MKFLWYIVSILLIAVISMSCQPSHKKNNASPQSITLETAYEMPPSIPNVSSDSLMRTLNKHWNLVSFPVENSTNVQSFLETTEFGENIQSVWSWDQSLGESGNWRVFPQHAEYEVLENVVPNKGYWVRARKSFDFSGFMNSQITYDFTQGWNLMGISHDQQNISITEFFSQGNFWKDTCVEGNAFESVWSWQNNTWKVHFAESGKLEEFNNQHGTNFEELTTLEAGMGLWIKTLNSTTPPTVGNCGEPPNFEGLWYSETAGDLLQINPDNSVYYCGGTYDVGVLEGNIHTFSGTHVTPNLQQTLSLQGDTLLVNGSIEYEKETSMPPWCEDNLPIYGDYGNDIATATPVELGTTISTKIERARDLDFFSITIEKDRRYFFESFGTNDARIQFFDADNNLIDSDDNSGEGNNFKFTSNSSFQVGQTYYFSISFPDVETGDYSFTVSMDDHGDSRFDATPIDLETAVHGKIEYGDDEDFFSMVIVESGVYVFRGFEVFGTETKVFDSEGTYVTAGDYPWFLEAGTYFFQFSYFESNQTGEYSFFVLNDDYGDTLDSSINIALETNVEGSIETVGDVDFLGFQAPVSAEYIFESTGNALDTQIHLFDSEEQEIAYDDNSGEGNNFKLTKTLEAGKMYYFKVSPVLTDGTGNYTVSVSPANKYQGKWFNGESNSYIVIYPDETVLSCEPQYSMWETFVG